MSSGASQFSMSNSIARNHGGRYAHGFFLRFQVLLRLSQNYRAIASVGAKEAIAVGELQE